MKPCFACVRLIYQTDFTKVISRTNEALKIFVVSRKELDNALLNNVKFISCWVFREDEISFFDLQQLKRIEQIAHILNCQRLEDIDVS